jgi:hypothetical protein
MKSFVIVVTVLAMLLVATLAYLFTPSVYATRTAQGVTVHLATLGEYPSDIHLIEVVEQGSGRMVWRVTARGEMFQLHRFTMVPGPNMRGLEPLWGGVQTDFPAHGPYELQRGIAYRASVVSEGGRTYAGTPILFSGVVNQQLY